MTGKTKKVLCALMAVLMICLGSIAVFAQTTDKRNDEVIPQRYANISKNECWINISGIKATMYASVVAKSSMSLKIVMELQKVKSGQYTTIETYTDSKTGTFLQLEETRLMNALATYRLKVTFTAGSESVVSYAYP